MILLKLPAGQCTDRAVSPAEPGNCNCFCDDGRMAGVTVMLSRLSY